MEQEELMQRGADLPSNVRCRRLCVDRELWLHTVQALSSSAARLLSLWGADDRDRDACFRIYGAWLLPSNVLVLEHSIGAGGLGAATAPSYPGLARFFPSARRMQRALHDLLGVVAEEEVNDERGWLRHGGWPEDLYPLRRDADGQRSYPVISEAYPFTTVQGDGVHEIAVGPVHAGTIEPGHFRFSVVGEKMLRLEERLGYTHKGVARRFQELPQQEGHRLAARLSGDSAVAFSWAYCAALESVTTTPCPARANLLRALALEHERMANHLGDIGAIGNDAGFAFGLTQFSRLKEDLLRANRSVFGARYLMDYVLPGGVAADLPQHAHSLLLNVYRSLEEGVLAMRAIYGEHAGLRDRLHETGRLDREIAEQMGALGLPARASGIACDLRADHPWAPYDKLLQKLSDKAPLWPITHPDGDVAARVQVRFDETLQCLELCRVLLEEISSPALSGSAQRSVRAALPAAAPYLLGMGLIEGWRGPVMVALETGPGGAIRRCHAHDSSWQNWPLLEYAILGNIVPDFPLINKSFNLSYSGQDG